MTDDAYKLADDYPVYERGLTPFIACAIHSVVSLDLHILIVLTLFEHQQTTAALINDINWN